MASEANKLAVSQEKELAKFLGDRPSKVRFQRQEIYRQEIYADKYIGIFSHTMILPEAHRQCYRELKEMLQELRQRLEESEAALPEAEPSPVQVIQRSQQWFQERILPLSWEEVDPELVPKVRSLQTELYKYLRLLATDAALLQASRQADTIQTRQRQLRDRLDIPIGYCDALLAQE